MAPKWPFLIKDLLICIISDLYGFYRIGVVENHKATPMLTLFEMNFELEIYRVGCINIIAIICL